MLGGTAQHLSYCGRLADYGVCIMGCRLPHKQAAIITLALLRMHFRPANTLNFSHF